MKRKKSKTKRLVDGLTGGGRGRWTDRQREKERGMRKLSDDNHDDSIVRE